MSSFVDDLGKFSINFDLDEVTELVFKHYQKLNSHLKFESKDLADVISWIQIARTFHNGVFDPSRRNIIAAEKFFDFEIEEPWAAYKFKVGKNQLEGNLRIRGTIDLITEIDENTIEIIDWKTGMYRTVFPTKQLKDQKYFESDTQLQMYFWAVSQLYPQYEHILITIYYINAGGPFTVVFHKHQIPEILLKLKKTFNSIVKTKYPKKNVGWHCNICPHKKGLCEQIGREVYQLGINKVTEKYFKPESFGKYKNPGE